MDAAARVVSDNGKFDPGLKTVLHETRQAPLAANH